MRLVLAVPVLAAALLAGCGNDTGDADAGATGGTAPSSTTPSPTTKPVGSHRTCAELYHPPHQLMQHAIDFVHGSPSAAESGQASDIVSGLAASEGHAQSAFAVDIAATREAVQAKLDGQQPALGDFDHAVNRLARHCELYSD